ncbi:hypothetical protein [Nocardia sp. NPDC049149]|uniref:polysaccharide biosynthesis C-terminal domain-containing protein n=1 Tax=Nocardia sp. NPDC049149 TaxID=3364315 RepID=UPI0037148A96
MTEYPVVNWIFRAEKGDERMYIAALDESTDDRGLSFSILFPHLARIGRIRDVHIGEIRPGKVRGNHYHAIRQEIVAVIARGRWSLHWDTGAETLTHTRTFEAGAIVVVPPRNWSHAVRNDGTESLWIVAASDQVYDRHESDPVARDAIHRMVVQP